MTREEAIVLLKMMFAFWANTHERTNVEMEMALNLALTALRPVSREQVEKGWRGEWFIQQDEHREFIKKCSKCGFPISGWWGTDKFCANCGTPMTDEAVQMVMERMEALYEQ